jgi:subfamily B ATP-binding cassette protein HlyB/CyaB
MDVPGEPQSSSLQRVPKADAEIEVEDLHFRHSERAPELFHGLSFRVRPGQCVAITGASGSGKSTLAHLLQNTYAPSSGRIRVGGCDIRSMAVNELRALLGVVPQETKLFSGTIYENLIAGSPGSEFDDVVQACRFAEVHETVEALPEGYQTWIGENGTGLSGGQRQRLAIARALLRKPAILIFDEATSQLDAPTATALHATVNRLKGRLSIIVIAHEVPRGLEVDAHVTVGAKEGGRGSH